MSRRSSHTKKLKFSGKTLLKTLVILAVCVYAVFTLINQRITLSKCEQAKIEQQKKITDAKIENQKLQDELKKADTDEYLENRAREDLGLVKANERVFIDITGE